MESMQCLADKDGQQSRYTDNDCEPRPLCDLVRNKENDPYFEPFLISKHVSGRKSPKGEISDDFP